MVCLSPNVGEGDKSGLIEPKMAYQFNLSIEKKREKETIGVWFRTSVHVECISRNGNGSKQS